MTSETTPPDPGTMRQTDDAAPTAQSRHGIELTRDQLECWAHRPLTDDEIDRLDNALPLSTLPHVVDAIVASFDTDSDTDDHQDEPDVSAARRGEPPTEPGAALLSNITAAARSAAVATSIDGATVRRLLPLPHRRPVSIAEQAAPDGTITYRFTGSRAKGALTITPAYADGLEPIPTRIVIRLGLATNTTTWRSEDRSELPTINGVTLHGTTGNFDPAEFVARDEPRLHFRRTDTGEVSTTTERYLSTIITAIITSYLARPQREAERLTVAHHNAAARLANLHNRHIRPLRERIDTHTQELADLDQAATNLATLATTHHQRQQRPCPDTRDGRHWFSAWTTATHHNREHPNRHIDPGDFASWHTDGNGPADPTAALTRYPALR